MKSNRKEFKLDDMLFKMRVALCKLIAQCEDCPFCDYCDFLSRNHLSPYYMNFMEWLDEETNENEED